MTNVTNDDAKMVVPMELWMATITGWSSVLRTTIPNGIWIDTSTSVNMAKTVSAFAILVLFFQAIIAVTSIRTPAMPENAR